jgi:methyl-accepting chemotaxis protein-1 (serine sensor receptor)
MFVEPALAESNAYRLFWQKLGRQVGKAISIMDEGVQQNAALVEQAAAASESIVQQVRELNAAVSGDTARDEVSREVLREVSRSQPRIRCVAGRA